MARQVITRLIDDLDGSEADETVKFAIDGTQYEVDLSDKNASELREVLRKYVSVSNRVGKVTSSGFPSGMRSSQNARSIQNREQNNEIRTWANANGYDVSDRGRIPSEVIAAYETKTPAPNQRVPEPEPVRAASKAAAPVTFKPETPARKSPAKKATAAAK